MLKQVFILLLLGSSLSLVTFADSKTKDVVDETQLATDVAAFYQMMVTEHGFTEKELELWFADAKANKSILKKISRPAEVAMPWYKYRNIFILGFISKNLRQQFKNLNNMIMDSEIEILKNREKIKRKRGKIQGDFQ